MARDRGQEPETRGRERECRNSFIARHSALVQPWKVGGPLGVMRTSTVLGAAGSSNFKNQITKNQEMFEHQQKELVKVSRVTLKSGPTRGVHSLTHGTFDGKKESSQM